MNILITGGHGFVGKHLVEHIKDKGEVFHPTRDELNLLDSDSIFDYFEENGPFDKVFHLAALSDVGKSWENPIETMNDNITMTQMLLKAILAFGDDPVVVLAGSSEEYGYQEKFPLTEDMFLRPISPYAISKVACENIGYQFYRTHGMKVVLTRAFNHEGPGRPDNYVTSSFAKQVAQVEAGLIEAEIRHGNLTSYRDYTDVRDMVRAYWMASEGCEYGTPYNICSGNLTKIQYVLDFLVENSLQNILKKEDKSRIRPKDIIKFRGDNTKFVMATGWEPVIPIEQTLVDILEYWRNKLDVN